MSFVKLFVSGHREHIFSATACQYGYFLSEGMNRKGHQPNKNHINQNSLVLHGQGSLVGVSCSRSMYSAQDEGPRTLCDVQNGAPKRNDGSKEPEITYEDVDTSLITPRPRLYGLVGAENIEEVWNNDKPRRKHTKATEPEPQRPRLPALRPKAG